MLTHAAQLHGPLLLRVRKLCHNRDVRESSRGFEVPHLLRVCGRLLRGDQGQDRLHHSTLLLDSRKSLSCPAFHLCVARTSFPWHTTILY